MDPVQRRIQQNDAFVHLPGMRVDAYCFKTGFCGMFQMQRCDDAAGEIGIYSVCQDVGTGKMCIRDRCQYDKVGNLISESQEPLSERDSFLTKKFEYISAERLGPRRYYDTIENENSLHSEIGVKGEKTAVCLYEKGSDVKVYPNMKHSSETSERLELQINAWLSEISPNIKVNVIPYLDVNLMGMRYSTSNSLGEESTNALNMGFGVSYSLPIIVALLSARCV